jgi:hypothetical protein
LRVLIKETVENLGAWDRPIAWTQHVTLGPPFLERGRTRFDANMLESRTFEGVFGDQFPLGADFVWPMAPLVDGGYYDLRVYTKHDVSAGFTTHLVDADDEFGYFVATSKGVGFAYRWKREDFPWLGIWEENCARQSPPWNGKAITRGMEFGASPMPESRQQMIERKAMFDVPAYKWLPAGGTLVAEYEAVIGPADQVNAAKLSA